LRDVTFDGELKTTGETFVAGSRMRSRIQYR